MTGDKIKFLRNKAELEEFVFDSEIVSKLSKDEPVFVVRNFEAPRSNKLVELEVTIRKGRRIGALKK